MPKGPRPETAGSVNEARRDADAVRETIQRGPGPGDAPPRGRGRPHKPTPAPPGPETLEDPAYWGEQIREYWNPLAAQRGYQLIPERASLRVGIPAALVAQKWGPLMPTRYPELLFLLAMAPYLFSLVVVEVQRMREARAAQAAPPATEPAAAGAATAGPGRTMPAPRTAPSPQQPAQPHYEGTGLSDEQI